MPQSNQRVSNFDVVADLRNYYCGSVATYLSPNDGPLPCYIESFTGESGETQAVVRILKPDAKDWGSSTRVPEESLSYVLPALGLVKHGKHWFHLHRHPARRMRKGYNDENIGWTGVGDHGMPLDNGVTDIKIVKQLWFGNDERVTSNIVVIDQRIFYTTDHVADVDKDGQVVFIPEKEKLGEFVCKALANNWESVISKTSVRTLPSSLPTP